MKNAKMAKKVRKLEKQVRKLRKAMWSLIEEVEMKDAFRCLGCAVDTGWLNEYYMVNHDIWTTVNPGVEGMLCIGCLEGRLGRELNADDFIKNLPINEIGYFQQSERLLDRLTRV